MTYWTLRYECWNDANDVVVAPPPGDRFRTIKQVVDAGCPVGAKLIIYFTVPSCWNGQLDSADRRSHLTYGAERGGQICPSSHPYLITPWQGLIKYTIDANFPTWRLSSDHHGTEAGATLHFDYWEGWSPPVKERWHKNCVEAHKSCSNGDLGDGYWIKQTPLTPVGERVPVPAR
jgi:hypothetical protein